MTNPKNVSGMDDDVIKGRSVTPEEVAYRDGYVRGKTSENQTQSTRLEAERIRAEQVAQIRADEGAANGLLAGVLIALIAACFGGALYYLTQNREPSTTTAPVEQERTIIERTVENNREVIQNPPATNPPVVNPPDVQVPDVNVTVPEAVPLPESNGAVTPAPAAPSNNVEADAPNVPTNNVPTNSDANPGVQNPGTNSN